MLKQKILMVDDEQDFCYFVKLNLEKSGKYQVMTAFNGEEGLRLAEENKPDLILLDIVMQGMDGGEVAWKLINNEATKDIPVIFITALIQPGEGDKVIGKRNFLAKPVTPEKLMKKIDSALVAREMR